MRFVYSGISLQNKRSSNMDSLLLKSRNIGDKTVLLAVVCDGVGSLAEGAIASGNAARKLGEWFDRVDEVERIGLKMRDSILNINTVIAEDTKQKKIQTASTLSALLLVDESYYIVHVGDSRIYSYHGGTLTLLTNDDISLSGKLTGYIGQSENIILQYIEGSAMGCTFLICSDGLYKRMDFRCLVEILKTYRAKAEKNSVKTLTEFAIAQGEQDNITVALVKTVD